ncbi:MAG: iron-containing alcohol dehydrogenase [Desulfosarcinaceae bacterium]
MPLPSYYEFLNPVPIIAGATAIEAVPELLNQRGGGPVMVVSDAGVSRAGLLGTVKSLLKGRLEIAVVADDIPTDSDLAKVADLADAYRQGGCRALIAVGGG